MGIPLSNTLLTPHLNSNKTKGVAPLQQWQLAETKDWMFWVGLTRNEINLKAITPSIQVIQQLVKLEGSLSHFGPRHKKACML